MPNAISCSFRPVLCVLGLVSAAPLGAAVYDVSLPTASFGALDQYSLDSFGFPGNEACVPTTSTNAMTYLQNAYPGFFGTSLTGTTYSTWETAAETLIGSAYMDTQSPGGTSFDHVPYALNKYIVEDKGHTGTVFSGISTATWGSAPYDRPSYVVSGTPTVQFLYDSLVAGSATFMEIHYQGGGGHSLLATGLNWNDANNDGIVQESEGAIVTFIDPLDPGTYDGSNEPTGTPKTTSSLFFYYDTDEASLVINYEQYHGQLPYDSGDYGAFTHPALIASTFAINVPEPGTWALLAGVGALALAVARRRASR